MAPADVAILCLLGLASLRGLFIGLTRELLSLAAIATACVVLRVGWNPLAERISEVSGWDWLAARIVAAGLLVVASLGLFALARALTRRLLVAAGLGTWDRLFGGILGAAEGALVAALLILLSIALLGRDHALLSGTRSLAAFEQLEAITRADRTDVAAPPP